MAALSAAAPAGATTTAEENARPGTEGWQRPAAADRAIEGYTSQVSVAGGEALGLHVSTSPPSRYRVEILRFGWYQGRGARRVACLPACDGDWEGTARPMPAPEAGTGLVEAGWPEELGMPVGEDWASGLYAASLVLTSGSQAGASTLVPFVVREREPTASALLVQLPVNTWQAYNQWGGKSLYPWGSTNRERAHKVSFERPWLGHGDQNVTFPTAFEYPFIRWAERDGYDIAYTTDVDMHRRPRDALEYRAAISLGHGEYWTAREREAFEAARDDGVNLAFLGANQVYWQSRYEDGERTLVVYKRADLDPETDPARETIRFRNLKPPWRECELIGAQFQEGGLQYDGGGDYVVAAGALEDPWMAKSGFAEGDVIAKTIQVEWDERKEGCAVPEPKVLFRHEHGPTPAEATRYTAASGADVFSAGSLGFVHALDTTGWRGVPPDPRLEAFMRAMLDDFVDRTRPPLDPDPDPPRDTGRPFAPVPPVLVTPPEARPPADIVAPAFRFPRSSRTLRVSRSGRTALKIGPAGEAASGRVALRARGSRLAASRVQLGAEEVVTVRLRLSRRARALLAGRRSLRAAAHVTLRDVAGNAASRRFVVRLRPRRR